MKKLVMGLTAALLFAACSSTSVSNEETKRLELQKYKQQLHELTQKIDVLEKELSGNTTMEVIPVKVAEIVPQQFEHFIEVTGNAEADLNVDVSPESSGIIQDILVTEGQRVRKGQVMARLKIDALERSLDEMLIQLGLAKTNYERQKNLWDQNIGSEMQFLQAKTNMESLEKRVDGMKAQLEMAEIKAPVDGIVDVIYQKKGAIGSPQFPFAKVVNIENIKVYADISETYLTKIKTGDRVKVTFPSLNREMNVPISQIGNVIDPNNRTFRIRIDLNNPDRMIKPNLVSIIKIRDYVAENAIVIPTLFVKDDFKGSFAYVAESNGDKSMARKVYLTTGVTDNNMTEVTSGLAAGMKIISEGFNQVADGTSIRY